MAASILMVFSAAVVFVLGCIHLANTFWGRGLVPTDAALRTRMQQVSPHITRETSMWRCWIGFNASHSVGAMLFGLIYGYLAIFQAPLLFHSTFLLGVGLATLLALVTLCRLYWFSIPFVCISIALGCYLGSIVAWLF